MPGEYWLRSFMVRHNLTKRVADNVRPQRAEIKAEISNKYFDNLYNELENIHLDHIFNYDEKVISLMTQVAKNVSSSMPKEELNGKLNTRNNQLV